ncbi:hypothetical protein ABH15_02410 [Methanoculleus taiwanensis]|uniref:HdeD family acid-resistance protein n=2 Tax=Methanoculleus taiwanensis TaxID=1550565 RepID=A0A498H4P0_9EURY|nr:hypothetical protein ABH15_02410 [Methanoculleus taiwanensis]
MAPAWLSFLIRGIIAVLFGLVAFIWSGFVLEVLVYFFGFFVIINAVVTLVMGASSEHPPTPRWLLLLVGILGLGLGILALLSPMVVVVAFLYLIAAWALVAALGDFILAVSVAGDWASRILLVISGILGIIFALIIIFVPLLAELVLVQVLGIYAIAFGVIGIIHGLSLRGQADAAAGRPAA